MPRDYKQYLEDIIESIGRIREYVAGLSRGTFAEDKKTQDAVLRNLQIIGDAVKILPDDVKAISPKTEWKKISALRDLITHRYFGVDFEIIWDVIENKLDDLETNVKRIMQD